MEVKMALIICLSVVFIFTLGIVSCTLRDKNFKARFDNSNERLKRIIKEQHDELISYREAIKKNDANLERSLEVLASASKNVNTKISRLEDTKEALSLIKIELEDFILRQDKSSKEIDEAIRSFSSFVKKINDDNAREFQHFEERLVSRPSYISPEEKKHFKEYLQACILNTHNMENKNDLALVLVDDVIRGLGVVGTGEWDKVFLSPNVKQKSWHGQNTERNQ